MEELKKILSDSFYTHVLMVISASLALILGLINRRKFKELTLMIFYPIASIVQCFVAFYSWITDHDRGLLEADIISESIFILIESFLLYNFFRQVIILKSLKKVVNLIFGIYFSILIYIWISTTSFFAYSSKVYLFESFCILSFCFIYFYQLFRLPPKLDLLNVPSFWITIGCLFYFSCTVPLFFMDSVLDWFPQYHNLYSINFLAYTILFILISKAFLCNPTQTA